MFRRVRWFGLAAMLLAMSSLTFSSGCKIIEDRQREREKEREWEREQAQQRYGRPNMGNPCCPCPNPCAPAGGYGGGYGGGSGFAPPAYPYNGCGCGPQ
jgi:hypothetical protein